MQPVIESEPIRETPGDDWIWPIEFRGDEDAPVDLTGCSFDGAAVRWSGGALPLTVANGRLAVDAPAGAVTVTIARADTASVPPQRGSRLVLPIVDTSGRRSTLLVIPLRIKTP
jgi:hypothetical protein